MHAYISLSKGALEKNYEELQSLVGHKRMAPVLKSNAYGHGLEEVYQSIEKFSPRFICTNYVSEAVRLRELGYQGRLLNVGPSFEEDFHIAFDHRIEVLITGSDTLNHWVGLNKKPGVHVKFDTGMSRQGFFSDEAENVFSALEPFAKKIMGICTHFANVEDVLDHSYAQGQLAEFAEVRKVFSPLIEKGLLVHASSSASGMLLDNARFDIVRIGISLYGFWPSGKTKISFANNREKSLALSPVLSFRSKISQIKTVKSGRSVGYGCHHKVMHDTAVAVVSIGYYEGLPRLADRGYFLVGGKRCPILGRICMNMTMIDVSDVNGVKPGDEVTIIGQSGEEVISAEQVADWSQTIHYEVVTRLNPQLERRIDE